MNLMLVGAVLSLVGWFLLVFVLAAPSGWVHVPLVAATMLFAKAIIDGGANPKSPNSKT